MKPSWSALFGLALLANAAVRFAYLLLAAAWLGPSEYALWPAIQAMIGYSTVIGLGAMPALARDLPILRGSGSVDRYDLVLGSASLVLVGFWLVLGVGLGIASFLDGSPVLRMGGSLALAYSMLQLFIKVRRADLEYRRLTISIGLSMLALLVSLIPIYLIPTLGTLFWGFTAAMAVQGIALASLEPWLAIRRISIRGARAGISYVQRLGIPLMVAVASVAMIFTFDRWVVLWMLGEEALARYALAVFAVMGVQLLTSVISQVFGPTIAHQWGANPSLKGIRNVTAAYAMALLSSLSVAGLLGVLFLPAVTLRFAPAYAPGVEAAQWILGGGFLVAIPTVVGELLRLQGRLWILAVAQWTSAVTMLGAVVVLASLFGSVEAVAIGTVVGYGAYGVVMCLAALWLHRQGAFASSGRPSVAR